MPGHRHSCNQAGFTLVELLVSMGVLALLLAMVAQVVSSTTTITTGSRKHMDADGQARLLFDRMAIDLGKMPKRTDLDCLFSKQTGNDKMFFYSEAPAYSSSSGPTFAQLSPVALVGYRVNATYQLERLGKMLTWDGSFSSATSPGAVVFLSYSGANTAPLAASTLAGNWTTTIGASPSYSGTDSDYHVVNDQVFRLEYCFQLKNGTYSTTYYNPTFTNQLGGVRPPAATDDVNLGYKVGSWWNYNYVDYVCTNNAAGAATWAVSDQRLKNVSAIVVALGILDTNSRKMTTSLTSLATAFADPADSSSELAKSPPVLMAETWRTKLNSVGFATVAGIPQSAASQVRIYQRAFYLSGN